MLQGQNFTSVRLRTQGRANLVFIDGRREVVCLCQQPETENAITSHGQWGGEYLLSTHLQPSSGQGLCSRCKNAVPHPPWGGDSAGTAGLGLQPGAVGLESQVLSAKLMVLILAFEARLQGFSKTFASNVILNITILQYVHSGVKHTSSGCLSPHSKASTAVLVGFSGVVH